MLNKNYKQFMKLFKLHEQVFVGFKHGSTHGFISNVDPYGFSLVQLANAKELFYPWDQFNLISVPGVKVDKVSSIEETNLWKLLEKSRANAYSEETLQKEEVDEYFKATKEEQAFIAQEGLCGVKFSELIWTSTPPKIEIISNKYHYRVAGVAIWHKTTYSEFLTKGKVSIVSEYSMNYLTLRREGYEDNTFFVDKFHNGKSKLDRKGIRKSIEEIRNGSVQWEREQIFCSDPWRVCDVVGISNTGNVLHTKQGPVMLKARSDLWF